MNQSITYGLTHIALSVKDAKKTLSFYKAVFDVEVMYEQEGFLQVCTPGCHDIIVFEEKKSAPFGKMGGVVHFGFRLKEPGGIEEITSRVVSAGGIIVDKGEFVPGEPYIFFKDPDGYEIEVWYELITSK